MEVRKEIIRTGKHVYLDEAGRPAILDVSPEKINHYHQSSTAMLAAGLPIPVPLEHQPTATPMNAADKAAGMVRNNGGEAKRFEIDKIKDPKTGEDIHRLIGVLDIHDEEIAGKIKNGSVKWVSPHINSFVDGKGKEWNEVVSHIALTTRPRIHQQSPFESIALALTTIPAGVPVSEVLKKGIDLSNAGRLAKDGQPAFPIAFSMFAGVKLGVKEIKDDIEDDDVVPEVEGDDDAEEIENNDVDASGSDDGTEPAEEFINGDDAIETGDVSFEELIPHLLEMHGISIPAGGKGKEFLKALVIGLLASAKAMSSTPDENTLALEEPQPEAKAKPPGPVVQESPPMYMSLTKESIKAIKDPAQRQQAEMLFSMQSRIDALQKKTLGEAERVRTERIQRLAKRLPVSSRDKLLQKLQSTGAKLSLMEDGTVRDPLDLDLEILESAIPDLPKLMLGTPAAFSVAEQPLDDSVLTDAQADELADRMVKLHERGKRAKETVDA